MKTASAFWATETGSSSPSPMTRIRTAFMRNGAVLTKNPAPPDNTVRVVAGHQLIGFTNPPASALE
ncbi:hypothetical protein D7V80_13085 [Corallococcus sp. CA054B]|uniref:hypothetical protein n=1 Tax=Corallococcus sp. CA054B TaxID=2316734 RepID=UPI000EA00AC8|nr:hypothetical protein [Corallococcus sp. CA054B]RKG68330.1 hypothetical protein D7V80_13085 [Corallococcus sp. CA054B]